ncbi:MAG TPA: ABC transporter permease [Terracidiphilus sp.]|jgi:predicted permease
MPAISDLRLVYRQLRKSPGFTVTAVLMLALGIGASTAIFSVVDGVLMRPLPFPEANRLVTLGDQVAGTNWGEEDQGPVSRPEVVIYARDTHSFAALGGYLYTSYELSGVSTPDTILASRMTPSVFAALGVAPLIGRIFTEREDQQKQHVAVLSYETWKTRFNGNPNVPGTKIYLEREPYIVIGVMPRSFDFPFTGGHLERVELWVPMSFSAKELSPENEANWRPYMVGRLKAGETVVQAEDDANRVAQQIMHNYPPDIANFRIHAVVYPLQQITVHEARPLLRMLFLAVTVVLLIACANFAGLLLVRAIRRQHESGIRLALGAPALVLLRQSIAESLVLSVTGALIGIALAAVAISEGRNLLPDTLPLVDRITLNWTVVGFALMLAVLTGVLCGLAPGFAALRSNVNEQMKEGGRSGSESGTHARLRSALVVLEIAVALVLLASSGLLLRSFRKMAEVNLGFQPDQVTTAEYSLPKQQYSTQARVDTFNRELMLRLRQLPRLQDVALTSTIPATNGDVIWDFVAEGYVDPRGPDQTHASPSRVSGDFFKAMGIPLLRGRYFIDDDNANGELVAIVNREFAEHYWPHQNPIGKHLRRGALKNNTPWITVVGEVADVKLGAPDQDAQEQFYEPIAQLDKAIGPYAQPGDVWGNKGYIVVRSALPPDQTENSIRNVVRQLDPQLPLAQATMGEVVAQSEGQRRFNTVIISAFALAAVLLAGLGIYSIMAFSVASRVQEMAIRIALGSQRSHILRLVLASGLQLAAVGCVLGLAGALAASKFLRAFLFELSPFDPAALAIATLAVFALALTASALPARRASAVAPIRALRGE